MAARSVVLSKPGTPTTQHNLFVISKPHPAITQEDFDEFLALEGNYREAKQRFFEKRRHLKDALDAGAEIEEGVHHAWRVRKLIVQ